MIRVAVAGAAGRMGREVVRAVHEADGLAVAAAIDRTEVGRDAGELASVGQIGVSIEADLDSALKQSQAEVLVDFTIPSSALTNIETALRCGVAAVVGTTGLTADNIDLLRTVSAQTGASALIAPNFAIGAVLMMEFAAQAAKHMPDAEIIELHHDRKVDSPSGT